MFSAPFFSHIEHRVVGHWRLGIRVWVFALICWVVPFRFRHQSCWLRMLWRSLHILCVRLPLLAMAMLSCCSFCSSLPSLALVLYRSLALWLSLPLFFSRLPLPLSLLLSFFIFSVYLSLSPYLFCFGFLPLLLSLPLPLNGKLCYVFHVGNVADWKYNDCGLRFVIKLVAFTALGLGNSLSLQLRLLRRKAHSYFQTVFGFISGFGLRNSKPFSLNHKFEIPRSNTVTLVLLTTHSSRKMVQGMPSRACFRLPKRNLIGLRVV